MRRLRDLRGAKAGRPKAGHLYQVNKRVFNRWVGRRQATTRAYFVDDRSVPWWAVCFTVVATDKAGNTDQSPATYNWVVDTIPPETTITTHGDGANRNDNKYIDNSKTYRQVTKENSIGIEFVGNFPDVRVPLTPEQFAAGLLLIRFLQTRYGIPADRIYAHNWIDYKDARYCEGCDLAQRARATAGAPAPVFGR